MNLNLYFLKLFSFKFNTRLLVFFSFKIIPTEAILSSTLTTMYDPLPSLISLSNVYKILFVFAFIFCSPTTFSYNSITKFISI